MADGYDTADDAAAAALHAVQRLPGGQEYEHLGMVYQDPDTGRYFFTDPQSQGRAGQANGRFQVPQGGLRGMYHNHPANGAANAGPRDVFSLDDMAAVKRHKVPSYIGVDHDVYRRDVGQRDKRKPQRSIGVGVSATPQRQGGQGKPVIAKIPMDQLPKKR